MLTPQHWQDALLSQSACNLQGIVRALARAFPAIYAEQPDPPMSRLGQVLSEWVTRFPQLSAEAPGTDALNQHPYCQRCATIVGVLTGALHPYPGAGCVTHPIPRLYAEQFLHLAKLPGGDTDSYSRAYAAAEENIRASHPV